MTVLPDFINIGAAKSGTSSLHLYLDQHPEIFMSHIKETNFFAYDVGIENEVVNRFPYKTLESYSEIFEAAPEGLLKGEASPLYLESPIAPAKIHQYIPHAKLIAILRNPVDRAISGYMMQVRTGREDTDVDSAFSKEKHFVQVGRYSEFLERYYKLFPAEQIRVYNFDVFKKDNIGVMQDIYRFLEVQDDFEPDVNVKVNVGGYPRSKAMSAVLTNSTLLTTLGPMTPRPVKKLAKKLRGMNLTTPPEVSQEIRDDLAEFYHDDILKLQDLTKVDFSNWITS